MAQQSIRTSSGQPPTRKDVLALWGGIAFSFAFTGLIWAFGYRLDAIPLAPDTGFSHYYWKLTEPTFWTRLSVWGLYAAHQLTIWGLIYYAQTRVKTYTSGLHPVNIWALGANAVFIVLHFVQTHVFYDGLAQDVSILTSQGSVIAPTRERTVTVAPSATPSLAASLGCRCSVQRGWSRFSRPTWCIHELLPRSSRRLIRLNPSASGASRSRCTRSRSRR